MYNPVCFSQYFVNKQNLSSFSNLFNSKLLKSENDSIFLQNMFEDKELVNDISTELKEIVSEMRQNIKNCCKDDFKNYLIAQGDIKEGLTAINKSDVNTNCSAALNAIVPRLFFGNCHNNNVFAKCTKIIIFSMKSQCLSFEKMINKWDISRHPWNTVTASISFKILYNILQWIFKNMLSAIISLNFYVTTCKLDTDEYKLHYFFKSQWQSFYDRRLSKMTMARIINKVDPYCSGKRIKHKYSPEERLKVKIFKRNIFKLHLILKPNNEYRPIVLYKNDTMNSSEKHKIRERLHFLHTLTGKCEKIENKFSNLYSLWMKNNRPTLYFVKTDLSNAFGSINKAKLLRILFESYLKFQKEEKSLYIKKKFACIYKEMVAELSRPLLIRAGSTIYEWKKGLVQGYKYSPALSELYYSYLDKIYFSECFNRQNDELKLFIRVVDDYLYITDSLSDAHSFLKCLSNYRNVNLMKTFVNFQHPTIQFSQDITFLGYTYNTVNLEVSRAKTGFAGDMCYKICFSAAISNLKKFLENRISQSGIQISNHIFNLHHNNEKLIWHHIFVTFCLSANKFCTILAICCDEKNMSQYLNLYKTRVAVKLSNRIIETLKMNKPPDYIFRYCINHFRYLSFKALLLCAQQTPKCNVLVPLVNGELAKTNCISGKWKEHSSRICTRGTNQMQAHREVCKRQDLKIIMKCFDVLPKGFQCFHHKKFYQ